MNFSLIDIGGLALSALSFVVILLLPGMGLAFALDAVGFRTASDARKPLVGLVVGLATLPALDSLLTRFFGLNSAAALNLGLAAFAVVTAAQRRWRMAPAAGAVALIAIWGLVLAFEWVDFDVAGKLYQPYLSFDMVKHAATTQAIVASGAPPQDPFFLRPERGSYYYFFYTLAALSEHLGFGLIDARAAVGGLAFWTGIGVFGTAELVLERGGFLENGVVRRTRYVLVALLACGGLDVVLVTLRGLTKGVWLADPAWCNEQITGWFESVLWVPHHVTALIALFIGFAASVDALNRPPRRAAAAILAAGCCFASALGLSIWVTLGGAVTAIVWVMVLAVERRGRACLVLCLVGAAALLLALPQLADLRTGRAGELPITLTIRAFTPLDDLIAPGPLRALARLLTLPLNYFLEFGILSVGALLFWRHRRQGVGSSNELARVLTIAAVTGLGLGTFLRSLIFNNDLGWRVMLLPLLAGLVWTTVAVEMRLANAAGPPWRSLFGWRNRVVSIVLVTGYATTLYAFVGLRFYYAFSDVLPKSAQVFHERPAIEHALRAAYDWANANLPVTAVLQHNPNTPEDGRRATAFGLYGHNPVAVSDTFASLFGGDFAQGIARQRRLRQLFATAMTTQEVEATARAEHVADLVVTAYDPVWADRSSWIWSATPVYQSDLARIIPVAALQPGRVEARR